MPLHVRLLIAAAVCLALGACSKDSTGPHRGAGRPLCPDCNVVLISMDTVRADHLGCYGYERKTSPNVDRLAREAVLFEQAVSQSAWTLPAHGSMMTGLYPGRLGVTHYPAKRRLPERATMLAEVFRANGYVTGGFVGGGFVSQHFGFGRGFDVYSSDGRRFEHNLDEALVWLANNKKRRFFMFFHGYNAHRPYYSSASDRKTMGVDRNSPSEKRGFCLRGRRQRPSDEELDSIVRYYDASIRHGDRQVGKLLRGLSKLGLVGKTIVLITSDHGEEFFEHGNCDHVRFLYAEVVDVPFILKVPGLAKQPRRVREVVPASISVPRTLLDLVGARHNMPGTTLVPILRGRSGQFGAVYSEANSIVGKLGSRGETIAMTTADHKLISYVEEGLDEAYDRARDPGEQQILPEGHAAYEDRSTLRGWHGSVVSLPRSPATGLARVGDRAQGGDTTAEQATPPPSLEPDDNGDGEELPEDIEEQLKALGYLE